MTLEVFFTADDFGMSPDVNAAILRAHREGALHGASLMMGQPASAQAVALARDHPSLRVGWHLHLCDSRPVTRETWPWGRSPALAGWAMLNPAWRSLMRREVAAQWEMFQATGLPCAFVNSHHHLHVHPMVYARLLEVLPQGFSGWIRMGRPRFFSNGKARALADWTLQHRGKRTSHRLSETLWGVDRIFRMSAPEVLRAIEALGGSDGLHEFMFHPRNPTDDGDFQALIELKGVRP